MNANGLIAWYRATMLCQPFAFMQMSSAVIAGHISHPLFDLLLLILLRGNVNLYILLWFLLRILAILSLLRILILGTLPLLTLRRILLSGRHVARLGSRRANVTIGFLCL
jgi:hypothetical protein